MMSLNFPPRRISVACEHVIQGVILIAARGIDAVSSKSRSMQTKRKRESILYDFFYCLFHILLSHAIL